MTNDQSNFLQSQLLSQKAALLAEKRALSYEGLKVQETSLYQTAGDDVNVIEKKVGDAEITETEVYEPPQASRSKREKFMMWTLLLQTCISWTLYGNIATFYPPYKEKYHKTITDTMIGVVLSMFELGVLLCSPIVSMGL